ncbi:unnamed protein product [Closterium sp. NIES-53]
MGNTRWGDVGCVIFPCATSPCPTRFPSARAPPAIADSATHSQWLVRDATARLAVRNRPPLAERAHFGQHQTTKALYDVVVTRYSSPATGTTFSHLTPPTSLSTCSHLLVPETSVVAVGAARGTPRTPFFEGCSPSPLAPSYASTTVVDILGIEDVRAASALSGKHRSGKGKGGKSGGGGSRGGGGGGGGDGGGGGGGGGSGGGSGGFGGGGGGSGGSGGGGGGGSGSGGGSSGGGRGGAIQRGGFGGGHRQQQQHRSDRAGQTCGKFHTQHRCFSHLDDARRVEFGDESERPRWLELLRSGVDIFALDYDAILAAMYALSVSAEGDCYLCVLPDLGIEAAALGASESALLGTAPAEALHTFTLDSGASRCVSVKSGSSPLLVSPPVAPDFPLAPPPWSPLPATPSWHALPPPRFWSSQGRQRAAPHSSSFPPTTAPLQTLHRDVWGPARVSGQDRERYFLLVVDDYTRYTTVFPLRSNGKVPDVLIPWIRAVRLQLRKRFREDLFVLGLHSDRGVMEVGRTSMIDAAAYYFLWPFAVRYAWHQLSLCPRVSLPATSPTLHWTGKVGDASLFRVRGSRAFVYDTFADKLSSCAIPYVFFGFPPDAPCWQFYHPTSRRVLPLRMSHLTSPPPVDPLPPQGPAPSGLSQVDPLSLAQPIEVTVDSGATRGPAFGGAELASAESGGAEPSSAEPGVLSLRVWSLGVLSLRVRSLGVLSLRVRSLGRTHLRSVAAGAKGPAAGGTGAGCAGATSPVGAGATIPGGAGVTSGAGGPRGAGASRLGGARTRGTGAAGVGGVGCTGVGDPGAGGIGVGGAGVGGAGAGGTRAGDPGALGAGAGEPGARGASAGGAGAGGTDSPLPAPSPYAEQTDSLTERHEPQSRPALPVRAVRSGRHVPRPRPPPISGTHIMALHHSSVPLRVPLPSPHASSIADGPDPESDLVRAAIPIVTRLLFTVVTNPSFESAAASALVAELVDFAAACRLDYAVTLVAESEFDCPLSIKGECSLGTDILEDRQEEFECLAAAVPHLVAMLLAPEGDPDAPDIPTPRSYAEAITSPYSSQWLKRPPGSPPVFKARYVAQGFRQRQGVDFFHTFSPTPKMTTLRVLLHVAAQRDYELHSLEFSTAFLQGSLHEEIWLRRPPGFTGSFPVGTQWSLRLPVYGLRQAPRKWHDTVRTSLAALGFVASTADPSLFLRTDTLLPPFYILVYIDNLVLSNVDNEALALVKSELQKRHTCTDLGELHSYLGLQITRDRARRTITLTQSHMVHQVLQHFGFRYSSPQSSHLPTGHSLSAPPLDKSVKLSGPYPELVGYLISSCEAEIYAGAMAAHELRWLTYLLTDLGEQLRFPPVLYVDNKAMIALCQEHRLEYRTKHIALRYFLVRELQQHGQLRLAYVATRANTADIFTKALQPSYHQRFYTVLGLVPTLPHLLTA